MVKNHIKRINAPKRWNILRKEGTFISRPNPGRDLNVCLALNTVLKDMLHKTTTTKESKYLIKEKGVLVNGVRRYDEKFAVGLFDVVTIPEMKENFRLLIDKKDRLVAYKIPAAEANLGMSKVKNKKQIKKGLFQINCTDGKNFLSKENSATGIYDTLLYTLPENKIKEVFKMEKGALILLYKGKHAGNVVVVEDFKDNAIFFKKDKDVLQTKKAYAFVIGKGKPALSLPE